jgi:hypothetical protein
MNKIIESQLVCIKALNKEGIRGLYFCRITADGKTSTKPFVVN